MSKYSMSKYLTSKQMRTLYTPFVKLAKESIEQMAQAQLFTVASSLAFTTVLSLVPALAVSFVMFKAFGGMERVYPLLESLILSNLAENSSDDVIATVRQFIDNAHTAAMGIGGVIGLIVTSMTMLYSIESAINYVWQVKMKRALFDQISRYWLFVTLGPLTVSVALGVATSSNFPLAQLLPNSVGFFGLSVALFFAIYKWIPHTQVNTKCALIASTFSSVLWIIAKTAFSIYTHHVVTYNVVYGGLAAIPILLLWIYIGWVIVLGGAAFTAVLQKRVKPG